MQDALTVAVKFAPWRALNGLICSCKALSQVKIDADMYVKPDGCCPRGDAYHHGDTETFATYFTLPNGVFHGPMTIGSSLQINYNRGKLVDWQSLPTWFPWRSGFDEVTGDFDRAMAVAWTTCGEQSCGVFMIESGSLSVNESLWDGHPYDDELDVKPSDDLRDAVWLMVNLMMVSVSRRYTINLLVRSGALGEVTARDLRKNYYKIR